MSKVCRPIILSHRIIVIIQVGHWIVIARSVSDEAIQRLWIYPLRGTKAWE